MHQIFFYLSFLPLTTGDGTFYLDVCPQMSLFLVGALYCIGFGMILSSITVVAFEGYQTKNWFYIAYAPILHFGASLTVSILQ
jgi:anterior pharynx defective protein 1